jgi:O-methyltransferase involved in polyketide biosynthesis
MRSTENLPDAQKIRLDLTGSPETMLATLYAKALDADAEQPILGDIYAMDAVGLIEYDWRKTSITPRNAPSVTVRTAHFDNWADQFLAVNDRAVVLHVGCGLDSRVFRLHPGPEVEWYDIDYPDVITLFERLYPAREHHHLVPASVTDPAWLTAIPADRPALLIAEGLTYYLSEDDGVALLRRVVEHFPSGELQFDVFNRLGIKSQFLNAVVRRSGSKLHWGVDEADDILRAVPGVRLLSATSVFDADTFNQVPAVYRVMAKVMSLVPALKNMAQYHRYAF